MMNSDALKFPVDSRVLCAVSGGTDSVALLHMCLALREQGRLLWLGAAHYHHGLRGQSADGDEAFVRGLCADWDVPFYTECGDTAAAAVQRGMGIEEAARTLRYAFLEKTAREAGADTILTAHNADDNWETMLLNLTRGTGLDGLCGIPPTRDCRPHDSAENAPTVRLSRPLLGMTRAEILAYLETHGQSFREDESNADTAFTRNRIRHEVLPVLRGINPKAAQAALQAASLLRADAAYLDAEADRQVRQYGIGSTEPTAIRFPIEKLSGLPPPIASRTVRALCRSVGWHSPSQAHVRAILDICASQSPHAAAPTPKGWSARREYGQLCISHIYPNEIELPSGIFRETHIACKSKLTVRDIGPYDPEIVYKSFNPFYVASDTIIGEIRVRTRRTGDRISLENARGTKSLSHLMIDRKIPLCDRNQIAVLVDDAGIVAVDGLGIDKSRSPREGAAVLELILKA